jgi:beta-fructofuranosidase
MELAVRATLGGSGALQLGVRVSADGSEQTLIRVDPADGALTVDMTRSTLADNVQRVFPIIMGKPVETNVQPAPFVLEKGEVLDLRVFIDKSIIEVYANDRQCVTARVYPNRDDATGVTLRCGAGVEVQTIDAWQMQRTNGV